MIAAMPTRTWLKVMAGVFFPRGEFRASGTRWRATTASDGVASRPNCGLRSRPCPLPLCRVRSTLQFDGQLSPRARVPAAAWGRACCSSSSRVSRSSGRDLNSESRRASRGPSPQRSVCRSRRQTAGLRRSTALFPYREPRSWSKRWPVGRSSSDRRDSWNGAQKTTSRRSRLARSPVMDLGVARHDEHVLFAPRVQIPAKLHWPA